MNTIPSITKSEANNNARRASEKFKTAIMIVARLLTGDTSHKIKAGIVVLFFCFASGCDKQNDWVSIRGWVMVMPVAGELQHIQKGKYSQQYDEFVGGLIDDGLGIASIRWLKPTYGNQNLLYTRDRQIGEKRQKTLLASKSEFDSAVYSFNDNDILFKGVKWHFTGYTDKTGGKGSRAFNSYVFTCGNGNKGFSVFYWGDGIAVVPYKDESVEMLLKKLSPQCRG